MTSESSQHDDNVVGLHGQDVLMRLYAGAVPGPEESIKALATQFSESAAAADILMRAASRQSSHIANTHAARSKANLAKLGETAESLGKARTEGNLLQDWMAYVQDRAERAVLTLDTLRERGDIFIEHEAAGCPPVLIYDYEVVMDGEALPRPCNYMLLKILPEGVEIKDFKRPYVIIDPRAGHGAGIGGFKSDSQVGVALADGHPVYFVGFRKDPVPGQTLADVTNAEAEFVREVQRRHPDSPRPVVIGNCQGGWATLLLAATNPDITGPIVLNGAPVAPWSGEVGTNPMRYNGGVLGGTWMPMFFSDLGGGIFDGAHLVMNFEMLNPSRNYFGKYYDLFARVDTERDRFLGFERWWGGFFCLNEPEIRWIVEQLFIGNRLSRKAAQLEPGRPIDIKAIRAPIIVFASRGDNITPPQQALNWIVDTYADEQEVKIRGQRIVYMVHEEVGHLGIFVSSKIAKKEHTEVTSTMKTIEQLPPGLYEMRIDAAHGSGVERVFEVSFAERSLDDIRKFDDAREDEKAFGAVARASEAQAEAYDTLVRPFVQAMVSPAAAEMSRALHPLRVQRAAMSSQNPVMGLVESAARSVGTDRHPAAETNPFVVAEHVMADLFAQSLDMYRDVRDALYEMTFFSMWNTPWAQRYGRPNALPRTLKSAAELQALPEVRSALLHIESGGFVEAVIRMLVMLADSRGAVRRDRLERSARVLAQDAPFKSIPMEERARIIQEQTLIATFEPEAAIESLPKLLKAPEERRLAVQVAQYIPGAIDEMAPRTLELLQRFHQVLDLPPMSEDVTEDPLAQGEIGTAAE